MSAVACTTCNDSGYIHDPLGGTLPCPYCEPVAAREAARIYDAAVTP